ncbi:hypothetical protein [Xanthocytophaga flava]|uniref:hypothetical protein n=1 Tax=Xanthocytophaga flava TaxID=3048013 RepID=UPI0028D12A57|nr:hypothetical protein [Xanthocytophaga flavus]MDJ1469107.1 hypothetical protein [Xanthocytophaga flavus]
MKHLLFVAILLAFTQCNTNSVSPTEKYSSTDLVGRWVWVQSSGGIAGTTNTPASTNETIEVEFTTDAHQRIYKNGQLISDLTYQIIQDTSMYTGKIASQIDYGHGSFRTSYDFDKGDLILAQECFDCFVSRYTRKASGND